MLGKRERARLGAEPVSTGEGDEMELGIQPLAMAAFSAA